MQAGGLGENRATESRERASLRHGTQAEITLSMSHMVSVIRSTKVRRCGKPFSASTRRQGVRAILVRFREQARSPRGECHSLVVRRAFRLFAVYLKLEFSLLPIKTLGLLLGTAIVLICKFDLAFGAGLLFGFSMFELLLFEAVLREWATLEQLVDWRTVEDASQPVSGLAPQQWVTPPKSTTADWERGTH